VAILTHPLYLFIDDECIDAIISSESEEEKRMASLKSFSAIYMPLPPAFVSALNLLEYNHIRDFQVYGRFRWSKILSCFFTGRKFFLREEKCRIDGQQ